MALSLFRQRCFWQDLLAYAGTFRRVRGWRGTVVIALPAFLRKLKELGLSKNIGYLTAQLDRHPEMDGGGVGGFKAVDLSYPWMASAASSSGGPEMGRIPTQSRCGRSAARSSASPCIDHATAQVYNVMRLPECATCGVQFIDLSHIETVVHPGVRSRSAGRPEARRGSHRLCRPAASDRVRALRQVFQQ
jgi:hypothetical protein